MSDCSYTAFSAPQPIRGQINWANGHRPAPLSYARFVNGEERIAESVEIDGVEYVPMRECSVVNDIEPRDTTMRVIGSCSECGHILCGSDWCCAHCGARVIGGGDE